MPGSSLHGRARHPIRSGLTVLSAATIVAALGLTAIQPAGGATALSHRASGRPEGRGRFGAGKVGLAQAPFLEEVAPEGLAVLATWAPDPPSETVTSYTATASVARGYGGSSKVCARPASVTVTSSDTSALIPALCPKVPYTVTMRATNAAGVIDLALPSFIISAARKRATPPAHARRRCDVSIRGLLCPSRELMEAMDRTAIHTLVAEPADCLIMDEIPRGFGADG